MEMSRGSQDAELIVSPIVDQSRGNKIGGQIIGVNLGWDFTSEHEWGIYGIQRAFGIPGKPERRHGIGELAQSDLVGADVRTVTSVPKGLKFLDFNDVVFLTFSDYYGHGEPSEDELRRMIGVYRETDDLTTAWCESSFGICLKKVADIMPTRVMILGQIYDALQKKDAMIFIGGRSNPFGNSGLIIAIRSRVPDDALQKMKEADEDYLDLMDAVEKVERDTSLKAKLKAAGKKYFALSPRWAKNIKSTNDGKLQTTYPVVFWLNPYEQRKNNFGYYTVEQLLEWVDGKGPIPITKNN